MYDVTVTTKLTYREVLGQRLLADLYLPMTEQPPPVALYVHGGGFQFGSRVDDADTRLSAFAAHGVAVLSIDYRLAPESVFPAQLQDVRAAVRWLKANADTLGVDRSRVAVWGASAGATLASLLALTARADEFEEEVDDLARSEESVAVQAVVAWFGLADLLDTAARSWLEAEILPFNFEAALLGVASVSEVTRDPDVADRARRASPLSWVSRDAPPFLIAHGDRDRITPASQSSRLHEALVRSGAQSTLVLVGGAGHEDRAFDSPWNLALTAGWLESVLDAERGERARR